MNRICRFQARFVIAVATLWRKLRVLRPIKIGKRPRYNIALLEIFRPCKWLEQSSAHNLEALLGCGGSPRRFHATDHVTQSVERFPSAHPSYFRVIRLRMRRRAG